MNLRHSISRNDESFKNDIPHMKPLSRNCFILLLCVFVISPGYGQQNIIRVPITMTDSLGPVLWSDTLEFGFHPNATLCLDDSLGEFFIFTECGLFSQHCWQFVPPPGAGRRLCEYTNFPVVLDLRPYRSPLQVDTFCVRFVATYPVTIRWPSNLASVFTAARIQDELSLMYPSYPPQFIADMLTIDSVRIDSALLFDLNSVVIVTTGPIVTGSRTGASSLPERFELYQNYPNPFNPSTTITFALPKASHVTLKVYNLLGQEVATLVNETLGPGTYERIFNAEGLPSGVYFYQLRTGGLLATKKMILVR